MKKLRILQFGETGQIGRELIGAAARDAIEVEALGRDRADFERPETVARAAAETRADLVVNVAAYTAVDRAEEEEKLATIVNAEAVAALAKSCAARDLPLIHISTDYVFDGKGIHPYMESDLPAPINAYGRSKLAGERAIAAAGGRHVILRTSWVYSAHGRNFVKTMLRLGAEKDLVNVVCDQLGSPTAASDIAAAILRIAGRIHDDPSGAGYGIFHYTGAGTTNWYDFATEIFKDAQAHGRTTGRTVPVKTEQYPTAAARPRYSVMNCEKIQKIYDIPCVPWKLSLRRVLGELRECMENTGP